MIRVSVGLLDAARHLLNIVERHSSVSEALHRELRKIVVIDTERAVDLALKCGWLTVSPAGLLALSPRGRALHDAGESEAARRLQLRDVLLVEPRPSWTGLLWRGRSEVLPMISADARDALRHAGLLRDISEQGVLAWWDAIASITRADRESRQLETGRVGERYSVTIETERTGVLPSWEGAESNRKGYDILSRVSERDGARLLIEVKTSTQSVRSATFFVSKGEWAVARTSYNYVFHLWTLSPVPAMAVVTRDAVARHIAANRGDGQWDSVEIPMRVFEGAFNFSLNLT